MSDIDYWTRREGVSSQGRTLHLIQHVDTVLADPQFRTDRHVLTDLEHLLELEVAVVSAVTSRVPGESPESRMVLVDALDRVRGAIEHQPPR